MAGQQRALGAEVVRHIIAHLFEPEGQTDGRRKTDRHAFGDDNSADIMIYNDGNSVDVPNVDLLTFLFG